MPQQPLLPAAPSILHRIIQTKVKEVAALKQERLSRGLPVHSVDENNGLDRQFENSLRDFYRAPVIAEFKRKSPSASSAGQISATMLPADPSYVARQYEVSNVACISVLTDTEYFGGNMEDLRTVKLATNVPILRKVGLCGKGKHWKGVGVACFYRERESSLWVEGTRSHTDSLTASKTSSSLVS